MTTLDALWHLLNLLSPAFGMGLILGLSAKLLWRRALQGVPLRTLVLWAAWPAAAATLIGLVLTGRDGRMLTYAAMVMAGAFGLWTRMPSRP